MTLSLQRCKNWKNIDEDRVNYWISDNDELILGIFDGHSVRRF